MYSFRDTVPLNQDQIYADWFWCIMSEACSAGLLYGHPGAGGGGDGPRGAGAHADHGYTYSYKYTLHFRQTYRPTPFF